MQERESYLDRSTDSRNASFYIDSHGIVEKTRVGRDASHPVVATRAPPRGVPGII